jgi:CheY-like chemotaxis protein
LTAVEKELEKTRRIETLGVLAGGIAHDFNNLLTIMMGNLSLLEEQPQLTKADSTNVNDALAAVKRARSLTQQLLTFSRGGAPAKQPGSIANVITESGSFIMSGSNARCEINLPRDLWVVNIDTGQMSQVVNNLLLNAQQAMPDGGIIHVRGTNHETPPRTDLNDGRYVEIIIEDKGKGIEHEHLDKIFDPYFSTKENGSGLGLTMAYSIVQRHDGLLVIESKPGAGTTCRIFLPASQKPETLSPVKQPDTGAHRGHILVMDDEEAIRRLITRILQRNNHTVETSADGHETITLYERRLNDGPSFDLVILDLTIPGEMGGRETLERLKGIDPNVKAIVISGYSNDPVVADYPKYGFCGRIGKPFSADKLIRAVDDVLYFVFCLSADSPPSSATNCLSIVL